MCETKSSVCVLKSLKAARRKVAVLQALIFAGILIYSQLSILDWDEGFHLVAASLIAAGKRPYVDFCFPQPALHAWWNALWLVLTGGGWRGPHAVAAVLTCGAIAMTADFVGRRVSASAACVAAMLVGLNAVVYQFGTTAQAYGACMFLTVAAFRVTLSGTGAMRCVVAGCLAGAAAGCSLLAAPACVILLLWHCWYRQWRRTAAFVAGAAFAMVPVLVSFARAPYATWFNLVEYHALYRAARWTGATIHDFQVLTSWVDSAQSLLLGVFAMAGLWLVSNRKEEFRLAAWMAAGFSVEAAFAHPTFPQYFIFVVPFLAMPAAAGFCEIAGRLSVRVRWLAPGLGVVLLFSLANSMVDIREDNNTWTGMELVARKVEQVTSANAAVLADPAVYFAMHRLPPSGMEFPASHKVELTAAKASALHIVSQSELERRVRAGEFATVETCKGDEDEIRALTLPKLYSQSARIADCSVYWGFK
jgi:hypothetical protein